MPSIRIRPLEDYAELTACVELQKKTWGPHFDDIVSAALMRVVQKIGGITAGAFEQDDLVGIVFGLTGIRDDRRVHWSHMLAVEPGHQGKGLGRLMKVYQRERVRDLGVESMYWTFDPLEARNAHFNFNVLQVMFDEYVVDMYGTGDSSPLHRGLGTDRFVVRWDLAGAPAGLQPEADSLNWLDDQATVDLEDVERASREARKQGSSTKSASSKPHSAALVEIPANIQSLKAANPDEAAAWRTATRAAFTKHLSEGRTVVGFTRLPESGTFAYLLE